MRIICVSVFAWLAILEIVYKNTGFVASIVGSVGWLEYGSRRVHIRPMCHKYSLLWGVNRTSPTMMPTMVYLVRGEHV